MEPEKNKKDGKKRYELLDAFRGVLMIEMVIYHFLFDVMVFSGGQFSLYHNVGYYIFQQSIGWGFIFLSGMCVSFSEKMLKRGLIIIGAAAIVSLVTYIATPSQAINFGVLCCIGSCMLLMIPVKKVSKYINPFVGFGIFAVLFFLFRNINKGCLGFEGIKILDLPDFLYANYFTAYLGFPHAKFQSGDYYALFPWFFLYVSGYFFYGCIEKSAAVKEFLTVKIPFLSALGKYSLLVYLLHQPVCYALAFVICRFM